MASITDRPPPRLSRAQLPERPCVSRRRQARVAGCQIDRIHKQLRKLVRAGALAPDTRAVISATPPETAGTPERWPILSPGRSTLNDGGRSDRSNPPPCGRRGEPRGFRDSLSAT
jgi:hypothetical protein